MSIMVYLRTSSLIHVRRPVWIPALVAILAIMATWRYRSWMPGVFFGDDLANYVSFLDGNFASTPVQALTEVFSEKYRPVFALAIGALFGLFGQQISLYLAVNVLIHVFSALIVFAIAFRLSRGSILVSFMSAILAVTSRFALYQVTQVTGLLEGIGLLIFLAMVYCLIRFVQGDEKAYSRPLFFAFSAIFAELLLVHTHERYLVVVPWVACLFLLTPNFKRLSAVQRKLIIVLAIAPALITILYKKIVLHSAFFVGTGGTHIQIDPHGVQTRLVEGILSLFGFNYGPEYLVGQSIAANPDTFGWKMALLFTVGWMVVLLMAVRNTWLKKMEGSSLSLRLPLMFLALIGLLLLPPIMTIRMEQRWLVQPFLILLMMAAWSIGTLENRAKQLSVVVFSALAMASLAVDSYISKSFSNIFFVSSARIAEVIKRDVVDAASSSKGPLFFAAGTDVCNWVLIQGEFFRLYGGRKRAVECIDNTDQLLENESKLSSDLRVFSIKPTKGAFDITDELRGRRAVLHSEVQKYDFLMLFKNGHINDDRHVDTPSGRGALILPWNTGLGVANTLTVLSGFSYTYDNVMIGLHPVLRFDVGMIYQTSEPARAVVKVIGVDGIVETVYSMILPLATQMGPIKFLFVSIPLNRYSDRKVSIVFSVETPGSDSSGHWVAFVRPRIVQVNASTALGS